MSIYERIRDLIAEHVEAGEDDPQVIAEKVLAELAAEDVEALARAEVERRVAAGLGARRRTGEGNSPTGTRQPSQSQRMRHLAEMSHDLGQWLVDVAGEWKPLLDCTVDEVRHVASRHIGEARKLADTARRYDALAKTMRDAGAETVADLPRAQVEGVMLR